MLQPLPWHLPDLAPAVGVWSLALPLHDPAPAMAWLQERVHPSRRKHVQRQVSMADRLRGLAGSWLLDAAGRERFGPDFPGFEAVPGQAPRSLGDEPCHASLAHAGGAVLVALAPHPVGVDVEVGETLAPAVAATFLTAWEQTQPSHEALIRWSLKEAMLKASGQCGRMEPSALELAIGPDGLRCTTPGWESMQLHAWMLNDTHQAALAFPG